jgi:hypothetical protein
MDATGRQITLGKKAAMVAASIGLMVHATQAATPHPLTLGLQTLALACEAAHSEAEAAAIDAIFCSEVARLLGERLGVPVVHVEEAGPSLPHSLPRPGSVWVRTVLTISPDSASARAAWGSHAPQRGVPASEEGSPVTLPLAGSTPETVARALAGTVVSQMPFVPGA